MFAGNVEVTTEPSASRSGPWTLSVATALGLGVAAQHTSPNQGFGPNGGMACRCGKGTTCTSAEREAAGCKPTHTSTYRWDGAVRLHRCEVCEGFFIAHYSARICSDACAKENRREWIEEHRRPRRPSKAAQRRAALAAARCQVCGAPFKALRLTARYCSNRCRQQHHREVRARSPSQGVGDPAFDPLTAP